MVEGLGFRFEGLGFRVQGSGLDRGGELPVPTHVDA